jgi:hypothetical protein
VYGSAPYKVKLYVLSQTRYDGESGRSKAGRGEEEVEISDASIQHVKKQMMLGFIIIGCHHSVLQVTYNVYQRVSTYV